MSETTRARRSTPAWPWYAAAGLIVAALLVADATGLLDRLGP